MKSYFTEETVMKRLLSILLAALMVLSLGLTTVYAEETSIDDVKLPFTDVKNTWYTYAIKYVYANGLMDGMSAKEFAPEGKLTRAQFAKVLWTLAGEPETTPNLDFADTKNSKWYAGMVTWAVEAGIVNGYKEGGKKLFKPDDNINRQEMAKMLVTFFEYMDIEIVGTDVADSFKDASKFQKWAVEFIDAIRKTGVMKGDENGKFNPKNNATRAECATIMMRLHPELTALDPQDALEKLVDDYLAEALCAVHGEVTARFNFGSSLTKESLVGVLVNHMKLDTTRYTLTCDDDGFNELKNGYSGAGRGTGASADVFFTITDNENAVSYEFKVHISAVKFFATGIEENGDVRYFQQNVPAIIDGACHEEYKLLQAKKDAEGYIENLKKDTTITISNLSNVNAETVWNEINNRLGIDSTRFELVLKNADIEALTAQLPASGFATINQEIEVVISSLSKEDKPADVKVPLTFEVGYKDPNPGVCDIETDAKEVLPGAITLDGVLGETEYTYLDTFPEEVELRDKTGGAATEAVATMLETSKVGFAWDPVNGLHIAVQWKDVNRNQTCDMSTTGDNMLFSGTSLNIFVTKDNDMNGENILYYGIGKNTTDGTYAGGSYTDQAGLNDLLLGAKTPAPNADYVISYGDDNMVTVEWTIPADALTADGFKDGSKVYLSLVLLGKNDSGFYGISFGNGGCFKDGSGKKQMTVNLKGNDEAYKAEYDRMNKALEKFLNSSTCIHNNAFNFLFTYGGSLTSDSLLRAVSGAITTYATEIEKETNKLAVSTEYYVTLDGDNNTSGYQALKNNFGCDWSAGADGKVKFILHTTKSDVTIPFEINVCAQKHFSLLDYNCKDGDFNDTTWDDAWANKDEGFTDALGVNANPVYLPDYCSDNYNVISVDKKMQPVLADAFDKLKDDNGTVVVAVNDLASHTAKSRTSIATIWHTLNDLIEYDHPEYYFVLTADDVVALINNGGEGKLRVKLVPSASWEPLKKASWVEYNFKFVQKDVNKMAEDWTGETLCGVHNQVEMFANFGSSWRDKAAIVNAIAKDMGLNTTTHTLEAVSVSENYSNNGCGNHSGDSDDGTFKLTEIATGASTEFTVHFSIMKYYNENGGDSLLTADGTSRTRQFPVTVRHNCPDDQSERLCNPKMFEMLQGILTKTDANGYLTVDLGGTLTVEALITKLETMLPTYEFDNYMLELKLDSNLREAAKYGKGVIHVGVHHTSKTEYTLYIDLPVIIK